MNFLFGNIISKQIYEQILQKIRYNDFTFNKVARHKYIGKKPNAFGIDKILYKCPDCKQEHVLHVEDDTVEENTVVEVLRKGYKLGDKVIRFAMVKVAN